MTARPRGRRPAHYTLRVAGRLDDCWNDWFDGFTLGRDADGTTTLSGEVADQSQLHGLLDRIRDLGLELLAVDSGPVGE